MFKVRYNWQAAVLMKAHWSKEEKEKAGTLKI